MAVCVAIVSKRGKHAGIAVDGELADWNAYFEALERAGHVCLGNSGDWGNGLVVLRRGAQLADSAVGTWGLEGSVRT